MFLAPSPGTETTMMSLPCCCTVAPEKPWPLTRLVKMATDWLISAGVGVLPRGGTAWIVNSVPPCKSRPRPTLNLECQALGCDSAPPMTPSSITMISATSVMRYRLGRETVTPPPALELPPPCQEAEPPPALDDLSLDEATCACP